MSTNAATSVLLGRLRVQYSIRYSRTARKSRIRVNPSGVQVILPRDADPAKAAVFLRENSSWVMEQLAFVRRMGSLRSKRPILPADSILLRGRPTKLEIVEEESGRSFGIVEKQADLLRVRLPKSGAVDPMKTMENWLRRQARLDVQKRLGERGKEMKQFPPARIYIMGQRTKWGGCSRLRNLSFNWRLVMAPPAVLDYIVVHELAHLIEPYHTAKFWLIVQSFCPGYGRHKAWLKDMQDSLRLHR